MKNKNLSINQELVNDIVILAKKQENIFNLESIIIEQLQIDKEVKDPNLVESVKIFGALTPLLIVKKDIIYKNQIWEKYANQKLNDQFIVLNGWKRAQILAKNHKMQLNCCIFDYSKLDLDKFLSNIDPETFFNSILAANSLIHFHTFRNIKTDFNPLALAYAYKDLLHYYTQHQLANLINKSRAHIANVVRLLTLPFYIQNMLSKNQMSISKGLELLTLLSRNLSQEELEVIIASDISIHDLRQTNFGKRNAVLLQTHDAKLLESQLEHALKIQKIKVKVEKNSIKLFFRNAKQLDLILEKLMKKNKNLQD